MNETLYLNSELVDLGVGSITRKIQIADFKDVSVFKSSFSYTKTLPKTSRNIKIMEFLGVMGGASTLPYEKVRCDYYQNGIAIIRNGLAIIKKSNNGYDLNLVDGGFALADTLYGLSVNELDWTSLDHALTPQTVVDSWENTEGYIYALGDFGLGYTDTIDIKTIAPSIFLHTIIDEIFEQNGLIKEGDFFTTNTEYLNELLTPTTGYLITDDDYEFTSKGSVEAADISESETVTTPFALETPLVFTDVDLAADAEILSGDIQINTKGYYTFDLDYFLTVFGDSTIALKAYVNGVFREKIVIPISFNNTIFHIGCEVNDVISFSVFATAVDSPHLIDYGFETTLNLSLLTEARTVLGSEFAPDVSQSDLIKDTAQRYGLLLQTYINSSEQVVYSFKPMNEILADKENAVDYTNKVKSIGSESYQVEYSQNNTAGFLYLLTFGDNKPYDGNLEINNKNLKTSSDLFKSIFEIPWRVLFGGGFYYTIPILSIDDSLEISALTTSAKLITKELRELLITLTVTSGSGGLTTSSGVYISLDDIGMQNKLDTNYANFKKINDKYIEQEVVLKLSPIDIYNFRFFNLIYLKQTQSYYYCDTNTSISGGNSTLTLIKVY